MTEGALILVGLRLTNVPDYRRRNWTFNRARWKQLLDWPIVEGHHNEGVYNMARASNRAFKTATQLFEDWDCLLYVGADFTIASGEQADEAVATARRTGKLTFAHDHQWMLNEDESEAFLGLGPTALPRPKSTPAQNTFSGALVVPRKLWQEVGGFDERFVGWGWEDLSFWAACCAFGHGFERVRGPLFHVYHPRTRAENEDAPEHAVNQVLGQRYLAARNSRAAMLPILQEPGGPLA